MVNKKIKEEFMQIKTGEEWNAFREKYAPFDFVFDHDMDQHFNELVRSNATKEQLENPRIHYEAF
ncbi:hypothetical protein NIA71_08745 [Ihubacter massiliensis]|uniref:hypothetical protein n=1 Tax=Ihubacter massiliensis TaxID=1852367 RepID=UPI002096F295|nr:hypothetical protein [Ihubacter massiliensis]MCO7122035.1 hypothetical protein [Ihubacter massiliensis]